jgi:hypothetical protein
MGSKSSKPKTPATPDPFPYTQPSVYYDPDAGMYYALTNKGQRTTNFSMIPMLNQAAMKASQNVNVPTLDEMFPLVSTPEQISALLSSTMSPANSSGAGRFLGLLGNTSTK